ncbi:MAG: apolipoprotein N-acyltransferase, partial [Asticcacaulis sp.]|nr:apolipoprotein N-acyltransferase [Asticcacaulis sp.]
EFLPYEDIMQAIGFKELVHIGDGFTPGKRTEPVSFGSIPRFLPLICYEGIFPSLDLHDYNLHGHKNDILRPKWILNISNDAWFGPTTGPRQHLNLASYRAIEEGLPMVRSTPTGVSVLVDPLGRIVAGTRLDAGESGFRDMRLPERLALPVYAQQRWVLQVVIACLVLLFVTIDTCVRVRKKKDLANR